MWYKPLAFCQWCLCTWPPADMVSMCVTERVVMSSCVFMVVVSIGYLHNQSQFFWVAVKYCLTSEFNWPALVMSIGLNNWLEPTWNDLRLSSQWFLPFGAGPRDGISLNYEGVPARDPFSVQRSCFEWWRRCTQKSWALADQDLSSNLNHIASKKWKHFGEKKSVLKL